MKRILGCVAALVLVASLSACSGDEGEPGPGGTSSGQSSSGSTSSGGAEAGALLDTGAQGCSKDEECRSGVCFLGNAQHFCTLKCTTDTATTVCEAPLTGTCNKQGFCKRD